MKTTVEGKVCPGYRIASGQALDSPYPESTIRMQKPYFLEHGLDLSAYFLGTLNISIEPKKFTMIAPEYNFKAISWCEDRPAEDFSMSKCVINFNNKDIAGLIYYPHPETKLKHFHDSNTLEVLAPYIQGIGYGSNVGLTLNTREIEIA